MCLLSWLTLLKFKHPLKDTLKKTRAFYLIQVQNGSSWLKPGSKTYGQKYVCSAKSLMDNDRKNLLKIRFKEIKTHYVVTKTTFKYLK